MAITLVGSASAGGTGTAASITHGLTIAANDVGIAIHSVNDNNGTITDNNGAKSFTDDFQANGQGTETHRQAVFSRVFGASADTTLDWTLSTSRRWSILLFVFRGVDTASIYDVAPSGANQSDSTGSTATTNSVTTSNDNSVAVSWVQTDRADKTYSAPTNGFGDLTQDTSNQNQAAAIKILTTAGAVGSSDFTISGGGVDWQTMMFALNEASTTSSALTGTATASITEDDITTGGKTIIITLTGDTFKAAGTGPIGSTADTQALIDGFDAAASPTNGWNNEVRDKALTSEVVRTSSTVATWTVAAQAGYDISSTETITGTIPTACLVTGAGAIVSTPTFTIDPVTAGVSGSRSLLGVGF